MSTPSTLKLDSLTRITEVEDAGIWVDVKHPNGEPLKLGGHDQPFRIRVAGSESNKYRAALKIVREENMRRVESLKDEFAAAQVPALCTLQWEGAFDDEGQPIELTRVNANVLYAAAPFIADQVANGMYDHSRFFPVSSPAQ